MKKVFKLITNIAYIITFFSIIAALFIMFDGVLSNNIDAAFETMAEMLFVVGMIDFTLYIVKYAVAEVK